MTIIKCKMCGGDLHITEGATVAECEYCGTRQTIPNQDDEKKLTLFARADRLRRACEFDKAAGVYESIVTDFPEEAEAYWGLVLCRYGIEYVDDPVTGKKVPTCHRSSFDSVLEDGDFEQATENADAVARKVYREEAKAIENIRRGILEVSGKEEPYDIFICYKETDENGDRTTDSTIAQDVYDILTEKGYRVFFSRISLEDKLGTEYEPYIFAALNSAKIMLVFGTDFEYFNAVWVKNEWSRFLKLMAQDKSKHLIPCYKGVDAYDMPKEFAKLQAQDMGKVGATQDLLRGIEKLLGRGTASAAASSASAPIMQTTAPGMESLLKRGYMALEDGEFDKADEFFEQVLNLDAECAEAYWGKVLAGNQCPNADEFKDLRLDITPIEQELCPYEAEQFERVEAAIKKYAVPGYLEPNDIEHHFSFSQCVQSTAESWEETIADEEAYWRGDKLLVRAQRFAKGEFAQSLSEMRESILGQMQKELTTAEEKKQVDIEAVMTAFSTEMEKAEKAVEQLYESALVHRDADEQNQAKAAAEAEAQRKAAAEEAAKRAKRNKKIAIAAVALLILGAASYLLATQVIIPAGQYKEADALLDSEEYDAAIEAFTALGDYSDAQDRAKEATYAKAEVLLQEGDKVAAARMFLIIRDYSDAGVRSQILWDNIAAVVPISAGSSHIIGLKSNGTVVATGDNSDGQCDVSEWTDVVAVSAGGWHTVGLKSDGTAIATGSNELGPCNVSQWTDVVAISAGSSHTVGLKSDGTVVAAGDNYLGQCNVSTWNDIVAISAGTSHTVGLKADGTVVTAGSNYYGQRGVSDWTNIAAISAGGYHTVGLKADGTVVAVGKNSYGQCAVSEWHNIVAISTGDQLTIGLKADGAVVTVGQNYYVQRGVLEWTDIVAVSVGEDYTVGLKSDGTVVATENNDFGQCDVSDWTGIKVPKSFK